MLRFLATFFLIAIAYGLAFAYLGWLFAGDLNPYIVLGAVVVYMVLVAYHTHKTLSKDIHEKLSETVRQKEQAEKDEALWKSALIERGSGFPTLLGAIQEYEKARDQKVAVFLADKRHPALKAAQVVREESRRRREAQFAYKQTQAIIEYYESIAPFLVDLRGEIIGEQDEEVLRAYDEEERRDPVTGFLTKEEYRKLSNVERNQLALDRFWKRPKSRWLLGRLYERYVGYLFETEGYDVEYVGIFKGYEDLGRDLICRRDDETVLIQCKNWSQFKTIYEKHIFQFFGTVFQYRDSHRGQKVSAVFWTTTQVSDLARRFAKELGIELKENFSFDQSYPCVKCNVSRASREKIYHLPFDQQYDHTKVEIPRGEFYCVSVKEAEDAGFRRALRWRGDKTGRG